MADDSANRLSTNLMDRTRDIGLALLTFPILAYLRAPIEASIATGSLAKGISTLSADYTPLFAALAAINVLLVLLVRNFSVRERLDAVSFCLRGLVQTEIYLAFHRNLATAPKSREAIEKPNFPVMTLFYALANNQEVLRATAFHYWESYFALLHLAAYALLSTIMTFVALGLSGGGGEWLAFVPFGLFLFCIGDISSSLFDKILGTARTQVNEMFVDDRTAVIQRINRMARIS